MLNQGDVMAGALAATHELIEAATDPDPEGMWTAAWRSLGPGVVARAERSAAADCHERGQAARGWMGPTCGCIG
jgi:hypothetical protein